MSYVARRALFALLAACSSPKPPAGGEPALSSDPVSEPASPEPAPSAPSASEAPAAAAEASPRGEGALGAAATGASSDAPVVETLFVRETLADCQAEGTRQCLQVRSSEQEDWRNFFGSIEGFQWEPSHAYELRVAVTPVANAPADAPALHYRLLDVVSKRKRAK